MTRMRFKFALRDSLKHLSHLDMMRLFQRSFRRSGLPLAYSEGYNPHLRFNLAVPLPVNVTASEEYGEVFFSEPVTPEWFIAVLKKQLPDGLDLTGAYTVENDASLLPSLVRAVLYRAKLIASLGFKVIPGSYHAALESLMSREEIVALRARKKNKNAYVNVRPYIIEAFFKDQECNNQLELNLMLQAGSQGGVSPFFVIEQLEKELDDNSLQKAYWDLNREKIFFKNGQ